MSSDRHEATTAVVATTTVQNRCPINTRRSYGRNVDDEIREAVIVFIIEHRGVVQSDARPSRHPLSVARSRVFRVLFRGTHGILKWHRLSFTVRRVHFNDCAVLNRIVILRWLRRRRPFAASTRHRRRPRRQVHSRRVRVALIGRRRLARRLCTDARRGEFRRFDRSEEVRVIGAHQYVIGHLEDVARDVSSAE